MSNQRRCSVDINMTLLEQSYMQHVRKPKAHKRRCSVIGFHSGVPIQQAHNFEMTSFRRHVPAGYLKRVKITTGVESNATFIRPAAA